MNRLEKLVLLSLVSLGFGSTSWSEDVPSIVVSDAWTPAQSQAGGDTPLYMTIANHGGADDSVTRATCPVANFVELRALDHGEGVPAERAVRRIAVPAGASSKLAPDGARIALLQTTQALTVGQRFSCRITFANAGPIEVQVRVGGAEATPSG